MAMRRKRSPAKRKGPCCKRGEIEIGRKCYKLYLVAAKGIVKGADCSNIVIDLAGELGGGDEGMIAKIKKARGTKKKKS